MIPFAHTGRSVTVYLNGSPKTVDHTHEHFAEIVSELRLAKPDPAKILRLIDFSAAVREEIARDEAFGDVVVGVDTVTYRGQPIESFLARRILDHARQGVPYEPLARFMDRLHKNPSRTAVNELFLWLEKAQATFTQDGCFLAFKKVKDDYTSFHTGPDGLVVDNSIGSKPTMERNEVDDNRDRTCSAGLHFCSWHYLPSYYGSQGRVVVLKIDPADVVSIPSDYNNSKGRAWTYEVVGEVPEGEAEHAFPRFVSTDYVEDDELDYGAITPKPEHQEQNPIRRGLALLRDFLKKGD